ncbi:MAG: hypothetical protein HZA22_08725 [Nitrospirae bacterium]|nr:hypothetical protein [Nitrospirota bacterium]
MIRLGLLALMLVALPGCFAFTTTCDDGSKVHHYLGYARVIENPRYPEDAKFGGLEDEIYGIRIENGLTIGYSHRKEEYFPFDCKLVVKVKDKEQLDEAVKLLSPILKEGLCVEVSQ